VAVVSGFRDAQPSNFSQQQDKTPAEEIEKGTTDASEESERRQKPPASVDERQENRDDAQLLQQAENQISEDKIHNSDAERLGENEHQVENDHHKTPPGQPPCDLVIVLYGDQGQTERLILDDRHSISTVKLQSGTAHRFIVSECMATSHYRSVC